MMDREPHPRKDLHMPASITHQRLRRALGNVDFPAGKDQLVNQALENDEPVSAQPDRRRAGHEPRKLTGQSVRRLRRCEGVACVIDS